MGHVRFENTYNALNECIDHLSDGETLSEQELIYADNIAAMLDEFKDELERWRKYHERKYVSVDGCGFVEIALTEELARKGYHSGECEQDVYEVMEDDTVRGQLDKLTDEQIDKCLGECLSDDDYLHYTRKRKENLLVWLACAEWIENN